MDKNKFCIRNLHTIVAYKHPKPLKINGLDIKRCEFKGIWLIDCYKRDTILLKKNCCLTKKKKQRKEETFSQVIHNPQSISFYALLCCQFFKKYIRSDLFDNSRVRTKYFRIKTNKMCHPFIFSKSFLLKSFAES